MKFKILFSILSYILIFYSIHQNCFCQTCNRTTESFWLKYQAPLKHDFNVKFKEISRVPLYSGNDQVTRIGQNVNNICGNHFDEYISFPDFGIDQAYSGDIRVMESGVHGGEVSIAVDPNNKNILWESHMFRPYIGLQSALVYGNRSENRGIVWEPCGSPEYYANCDQTSIVQQNGMLFVGFMTKLLTSFTSSIHMAYYDTIYDWQLPTNVKEADANYTFDKPHFAIDNTVPNGNIYCAWSNNSDPYDESNILITRSSDNGINWDSSQVISTNWSTTDTAHNGANIQIGPNGEVYVVWASYDMSNQTDGDDEGPNESGLIFVRSLDQGESYLGNGERVGYLIRPIHGLKNYMDTQKWKPMPGNIWFNSFPSMCVDKSDGPHRGRIYIVWANHGPIDVPDYNGDDIYTYIIFSDNQGEPGSWTEPVSITPYNTAGVDTVRAFYPWISCDDETGLLSVIYYWTDVANGRPPDDIFINVAMSRDFGTTWQSSRVGDYSFQGSDRFYGDYLGICSKDGLVYPTFSDSRDEECLPQVFISPFYAWNCIEYYDETDPSVNELIDADHIRKWEAMDSIHSRNKISANGVAVYNAGYEVRLLPSADPFVPDAPEFHAAHGSFVHVFIEGCDPFEEEVDKGRQKNTKAILVQNPKINFDIYPNPTQGIFYLKNNTIGDYKWNVEIENSLGTTILKEMDISTRYTTFDISKFPNGIYFVKMGIGNKYVVKKIILNRV